jgi:hypothetical protein
MTKRKLRSIHVFMDNHCYQPIISVPYSTSSILMSIELCSCGDWRYTYPVGALDFVSTDLIFRSRVHASLPVQYRKSFRTHTNRINDHHLVSSHRPYARTIHHMGQDKHLAAGHSKERAARISPAEQASVSEQ